jgi:ferritin-like metal-binding protein YciE
MELVQIEDAEMSATQALQRMAGEAGDGKLRQKLEQRLRQGERVLQRVRGGLEKLGGNNRSETQNTPARGLIQEMERSLREMGSPELKAAAMIGGVQKLEHYCIAAWGTVKALAAETGNDELAKGMAEAIEEGYRLDEDLSWLAEHRINLAAMEAGSGADFGGDGKRSGRDPSGGGSAGAKSERSTHFVRSEGSSDDLKSREYRGEDGQIHHHTREYMERKGE